MEELNSKAMLRSNSVAQRRKPTSGRNLVQEVQCDSRGRPGADGVYALFGSANRSALGADGRLALDAEWMNSRSQCATGLRGHERSLGGPMVVREGHRHR